MKAYIQTDANGNFHNVNAFVANQGFLDFGWEVEEFEKVDEITDRDPEAVLVGGIGAVRKRLLQLGLPPKTDEIDYPPALNAYLGRKVWTTTLEALFATPEQWNIFIKPQETKKFAGKIVSSDLDFIGLFDANDEPTPIWCSELITFVTEWRCFVRYGEIIDIRRYKGAWDTKIDLAVVQNAIQDFTTIPAACALDFGITPTGSLHLVEVNDGHSLGTYGMNPPKYARFLSARWAEMTGTTDYLRF
jgi:ATP-grasp domain, R2K clade family 3